MVRNSLYDLFQAFDFGDATSVNAPRASTTVAPQSLFLMNSPLVRDSARAFAASLLSGPRADDAFRVRLAYYRALGRPASPAEIMRALAYLFRYDEALASAQTDVAARRTQAWQSFSQALLASNEFLYLE